MKGTGTTDLGAAVGSAVGAAVGAAVGTGGVVVAALVVADAAAGDEP